MIAREHEENCDKKDKDVVAESGFQDTFLKLVLHNIETSEQELLLQHECKLLDELMKDFEWKGKALKQSTGCISNKPAKLKTHQDNEEDVKSKMSDDSESVSDLCQKFRNSLSAYNQQVSPRNALGCGDSTLLRSQLKDILTRTAPLDSPEYLPLAEAQAKPS